ncbi:serine/threonine-protein kinase [Haliangium ochraceum]|uniref:Serine/threonine protein kinase n=1 Tax=Haliangium ochraceum (strain DSM 14365 / JCM 11303 / SMP-2) TaxID=502025 RepID=D0LHU6_HALO1|nr:serine/threonine-protein kinase [Haliangium ochraceum]ACY14775.1 serine/threonine protein kinase [Haliangium ochraceum DSM 14365]
MAPAPLSGPPTIDDLGHAETLSGELPSQALARPRGPGERIYQYEIIRELGRGGMGAVYLARDLKLARRVAIKFLLGGSPAQRERFLLEARATARCNHENIVVIHEVNEYRETPFLVLEYLEGRALGSLIGAGPMAPQQAVALALPIARALAHAHGHEIVHRDLKPDNVLVTEAGAIKVLDFGIAKLLAQGGGDGRGPGEPLRVRRPDDTQLGALVGTLAYMSPEQWRGEEVDHRSDLWAFGVMLYEMVVGHHPLERSEVGALEEVRELDVPMPRVQDGGAAVPEDLVALIERCLIKPREQRIASAQAVVEALEAMGPNRPSYQLAAGENPYLGLATFQVADENRYFGRAREIDEVLARMGEQPLLGVAGPTGIGKSSFVRAGLLATLARAAAPWESVVVRPGRDPFAALARAVAPWLSLTLDPGAPSASKASARRGEEDGAAAEHTAQRSLVARLRSEPGYLGTLLRHRARRQGTRILLVIDPFEELYTLTADADTRLAFTACLAGVADDAAEPVRVMISVRSDFLDRLAEDRHFLSELTNGLVFLAAPDRRGLAEALTHPAQMAGYRFESQRMVDEILDAVEATPGSLPLLQFVATKLWERRDTEAQLLTEDSYRELGGIFGALASHADAVVSTVARTSPRAYGIARTLMQRLVTAERTRAIASMAELREIFDSESEVDQVIGRLVEARLLVVQSGDGQGGDGGGATVEIVHDSLIHSWPRLRRWLDDTEDDQVFLDQLRAVAKRWEATGRPHGLLWRDEAAREARRWRERYQGRLSAGDEAYLRATFALEGRITRRRRVLAIAALTLLAAVALTALVAAVLIRDAEQRAQEKAASEAVLRRDLQRTLNDIGEASQQLQASERARQWARAQLVRQEDARLEAERAADRAESQAEDDRRRLMELLREIQAGDGAMSEIDGAELPEALPATDTGAALESAAGELAGAPEPGAEPGAAGEDGAGTAAPGDEQERPPPAGADTGAGAAATESGTGAEGAGREPGAGAALSAADRAALRAELERTREALQRAQNERDALRQQLGEAGEGAGPGAGADADETLRALEQQLAEERALRESLQRQLEASESP